MTADNVADTVVAGGVYFAYMLIFNREVLDTEPGHNSFGNDNPQQ